MLAASYMKPYVLPGFRCIKGNWRNGFVIENLEDESQFVWVVDYYDFLQKNHNVHLKHFDVVKPELIESVAKYGGFYISRYKASKVGWKICFRKDREPITDVSFAISNQYANDYLNTLEIGSCIPSGSCWDAMCEFLINSDEISEYDVKDDSTYLGWYINSKITQKKIQKTGTGKSICNIYDLNGNCSEWTSEIAGENEHVTRGGFFYKTGDEAPLASRTVSYSRLGSTLIGFRTVIYKRV